MLTLLHTPLDSVASFLELMFHTPVLAEAVVHELVTPAMTTVYDGTLGLGGHAELILGRWGQVTHYFGSDLDPRHRAVATERLSPFGRRVSVLAGNFADTVGTVPTGADVGPTAYLLDLGLCSAHIDDGERGFSFRADGPLSCRYDGGKPDAGDYLAEVSVADLTACLRTWGEEPYARPLAQAIVRARDDAPLTRTGQLVAVVEAHTPEPKRKKTLMRVFQALRIAVNDEMMSLRRGLDQIATQARPGDRVGVITYHSLEDRITKRWCKALTSPVTAPTPKNLHSVVAPARAQNHSRKPLLPTAEEIAENPRSRSAKLRIITFI